MKFRKSLLVIASAAAMGLSACGASVDPAKAMTVCLASEPESLDPALNSAVDGATLLVHLMGGVKRYEKPANGNGGLILTNDLAESVTKKTAKVVDHVLNDNGTEDDDSDDYWEPEIIDNGTQYTVKLREGLKWSNGDDLTSDDFIYAWNRASGSSLGADYGYMFENFADYAYHSENDTECPSLAIRKIDDRTFSFDIPVDVAYFDQLLAFPTFYPVNRKAVEASEERGGWAAEAKTFVSCGAYTMASWKHNSNIVLKKNPNYWDADKITMEQITFALSDDDEAMLASYKAGQYELIDSVPQDQMDAVKRDYPNEYKVTGQMGTYYVSFNVNAVDGPFAGKTEQQKAEIRKALGLLINRQYIVDNIGKADQIPANAFVSAGLSDPAGGEFVDHNGPERDGAGYYKKGTTTAEYEENVAKAVNILRGLGFSYNETTKKFENFPAFTYLYNNGSGHKAIAENLRDTFAQYGITLNLDNQEWATFLQTRKQGNFTMARNGWLADYDDPSSYLTMWTTASGNNDSQFGRDASESQKGNHKDVAIYEADIDRDGTKETGLTWAQSYDVLMKLAANENDASKRFAILHDAEDLLMETGAICPIYYYTDVFMIKENIKGFFSSPLGYKWFMYCTKA